MKKYFFLINVLLVIIAAYLGYEWYLGSSPEDFQAYNWKKTTERSLTPKETGGRGLKLPRLTQFELVGKKTMFRPERKEWVPPPPPPTVPKVKKAKKKPAPVVKKAPPPPPYPDPELFGIIIYDSGEKLAIMRGHTREVIDTPPPPSPADTRSSRRRSRRRVRRKQPPSPSFPKYKLTQDKTKRYSEGQVISGNVIKKIHPDKVVLQKIETDEKFEIKLRDTSRQKSQPTSKSASSPPQKVKTQGGKKRPGLRRSELLKRARRNLLRNRRRKGGKNLLNSSTLQKD